jgi:hypothetical protein
MLRENGANENEKKLFVLFTCAKSRKTYMPIQNNVSECEKNKTKQTNKQTNKQTKANKTEVIRNHVFAEREHGDGVVRMADIHAGCMHLFR